MMVYGYFQPKSLVQRLHVLDLLAAQRDNFCDCVHFFFNKGLNLALFPPTWTRPTECNRHFINGFWIETSAKPGSDSHIGELSGGVEGLRTLGPSSSACPEPSESLSTPWFLCALTPPELWAPSSCELNPCLERCQPPIGSARAVMR